MLDFIANPYPHFHALRRYSPICQTPQNAYLISRHDDVAAILKDKRFGRDFANRTAHCYGTAALQQRLYRCASLWSLELDPPKQTRIRNVLLRVMTFERFEAMRSSIQRGINRMIEAFKPDGHMDIIEDFAFWIPMTTICDLLGIPEGDRTLFYHGARIGSRLLDITPVSQAELAGFDKRISEVWDYFQKLVQERRDKPADDLVSALATDHNLTDDELIANLILLFGAGYETTVHLIGNGLLALYRNPIQLQLLRDDLSLIHGAVEEILRYDSPTQATIRVALEDVFVPKGSVCICLIGAAHRDPSVYPAPDTFDILRRNVRPLSFGGGVHACVGAALARMQAQIAIVSLLDQLPNMEIAINDLLNPSWRQTFVLRGLNHLEATWLI